MMFVAASMAILAIFVALSVPELPDHRDREFQLLIYRGLRTGRLRVSRDTGSVCRFSGRSYVWDVLPDGMLRKAFPVFETDGKPVTYTEFLERDLGSVDIRRKLEVLVAAES